MDADTGGASMESQREGEIVVLPSIDAQVRQFERGLLALLDQQGLPTSAIFTGVDDSPNCHAG